MWTMSAGQDLLEQPAPPPEAESTSPPKEIQDLDIWERIAHYSPYTAELVGTALLALVWNCSTFAPSTPFKPLVMGLLLMVLTYSFSSISGAQFNPAVTLAVGLAGKGDWRNLCRTWIAQFLGAGLGVGASCLMFGKSSQDFLGARPEYHSSQVFVVETVYTFMLSFVYLNTLLSRGCNPVVCGNQFFGVAMGFAMMAAWYAAEGISGAVFNPAIAFAVYIENSPHEFWTGIYYLSAHLLAAFLAATVFRIVRPHEQIPYEEWLVLTKEERDLGITHLKSFSEGVGTWLFVFTIGMTHLSSQNYVSARPLAGAAVYISMHYSLADRSGGYFNPAVTLAVVMSLSKRCSFVQGLGYICVQIFSATIAALACESINDGRSVPVILDAAATAYGTVRICTVELIFMNITCLALLSTKNVKGLRTPVPQNFYHGLVFGLAYAGGGFATYGLTRGVLNPSLAIGLGLAGRHSDDFFRRCLCMAAFEFGGSIFAVIIFRLCHWRAYRTEEFGMGAAHEAQQPFAVCDASDSSEYPPPFADPKRSSYGSV